MNNKGQLLSRFLQCLASIAGFCLLLSSCSLWSKQEPETQQPQRQQGWYACTGNDQGAWDCGGQLPPRGKRIAEKAPTDLMEDNAAVSSRRNKQGQQAIFLNPDNEAVLIEEKNSESAVSAVYTIQIGAFAGEAKRDEFILENGLSALPLAFFESEKDGRTWWVLGHGEFADIEAARTAQSDLVVDHGISDVWIRPLAQLKPQLYQQPGSAQGRVKSKEVQSVSRYSIQLAAFRTERQRRQFIDHKGLADLGLRYTEEERQGVQWWIALYGQFDSVREAAPEQVRLESEYGLKDTWIRPNP